MKRIKEIFNECYINKVNKKGKCLIADIDNKKIVIKDNSHNILNTIEMALKYALNNGYISPKNLENLDNLLVKEKK